jgi:transcriptional regulator with XRE-family HTH domain
LLAEREFSTLPIIMPSLSDSIAGRVKELRLAKGWSQEELAEEADLSRDAVSRIERGDRSPRIETLDLIAGAIGIPLSKLIDFEVPVARGRVKDDILRSIKRSLDQVDPAMAKALLGAIRSVTQAHLKAMGRGRTTLARRGAPSRKRTRRRARR